MKKKLKSKIFFFSLSKKVPCPVIACVIKNKNQVVFGTAANLSVNTACIKALVEAVQLLTSTKHLNEKPRSELEKTFRQLLKTPPKIFNFSACTQVQNASRKELFNWFKKNKLGVYFSNITLKQFKKYGFATKVFVPDLLQFGVKKSIIFKKNEKLAKKNNSSLVNPFV